MITDIEDLISFLHEFHKPWGKLLPAQNIPNGLPRPLRRIYEEFGSLFELQGEVERSPFSAQDHLYPPDGLKFENGMCTFAMENQGNWTCRFPLSENDPCVFSNARDVWESPAQGFIEVCLSLEHF